METKVDKLAIHGGKKVWTKGFPAWPQFDRKTDRKVLDILHSGKVNYWTGPVGMQFEAAWAKWLGVKNAVSVSNGTAARIVAFLSLGLDPKTEKGAVVSRHACGEVANIAAAVRQARRCGLPLVEDCTECVGGVFRGRKAGTFGKVSFFSFDADGALTAGDAGGMVCTDDDGLAWEIRSLRDHGYDVRAKLDLLKTEGKQAYIHRRVGYNFRMTEIQSAIGLGELRRFDTWNLPRRRKLGKALVKGLAGHPLVKRAPIDTKERQNSFWQVPFVLDTAKMKGTMKEFVVAVQAEGAAAHLATDDTISFWTHPTYTLAHIRADIKAFQKVAAAIMK